MRKNQAEVDAVPIGRAADEPEFREPKLFNGDQLYPGKLVFAVNPVCYVLRAGDKYLAIGRIAATKSWQVCSTFAGTSAGLIQCEKYARALAASGKLADPRGSRDRYGEVVRGVERAAPLPRVHRTNRPEAYSLVGRDGNS